MSIRGRAILGAIAFFGGLLLLTGAGVSKSSARINFERRVERKDPQVDPARPPSKTVPNLLMVVGALASVGGLLWIGMAAREMAAEIGSAGSAAERAMQRELMEKRDPKPKP